MFKSWQERAIVGIICTFIQDVGPLVVDFETETRAAMKLLTVLSLPRREVVILFINQTLNLAILVPSCVRNVYFRPQLNLQHLLPPFISAF